MSFQTNVTNGLNALATAIKTNRVNTGTLASLTTTAKSDLVSAINEVKAAVSGAAGINDSAASSSTTATYSANKITSLISSATSNILNGASAAYDTLGEIQAILQADDASIATILTALGNRLRVDVNNQGLTGTQQTNGQTNLGVYSTTQIGDVTHDFTADVAAALA